jgi:hypothetical protein
LIIRRDVDYVGLGRLNDDDLFATFNRLGLHCLLRARFQISCALSLGSHPLDRRHHIGLLRQKRVPEIGRPLNIPSQSLDDVRNGGQGLDTGVPRLFGDGVRQCFIFQIFVAVHPLLELDDFQGISGSSQSLRQKRIGIQCDRRNERVQLIRRNCLSRLRFGRRRGHHRRFALRRWRRCSGDLA